MYTKDDLGEHIANKDNAMRLIEWLVRGAPHAVFNINYGSISRGHAEDADERWAFLVALSESIGVEDVQAVASECGTVCCIAGAAAQMHRNEFGSLTPSTDNLEWEEIQAEAFEYLGLDYGEDDDDQEDAEFGMWGLFDPDKWLRVHGTHPSGPEAAEALVRYSQTGDWEAAIADVFPEQA